MQLDTELNAEAVYGTLPFDHFALVSPILSRSVHFCVLSILIGALGLLQARTAGSGAMGHARQEVVVHEMH
jgi:hypothetical protein